MFKGKTFITRGKTRLSPDPVSRGAMSSVQLGEMSGSANGIRYLIRVWGFTIQEILDLLRIASGANGCSSDGLLTVMLLDTGL